MNRITRLLLLYTALPAICPAIDIKGKVVDAQSGEVIARARVTGTLTIQRQASGSVAPPETREVMVMTDVEGNFVFHNAEGGYLELTAERTGYVHNPAQATARLQVWGEQPPDPVSLRLNRQAVLEGRLTGESGRPLSGQVALYYAPPGSASKPQALRIEYVDRAGEFRFANLESGRYFLRVTNAGDEAGRLGGKAYLARYYPDRTDIQTAAAFNLNPGQEEHVEFAIAAVSAHQIHGRFASGERPGIFLANGNGDGGVVNVEVEADEKLGTFTVSGVPAGIYNLTATWDGGRSVAQLTLTVDDADVSGIVLTPQPVK